MNATKEFFDSLDRSDVTHVLKIEHPKKETPGENDMAAAWKLFQEIGCADLADDSAELIRTRLELVMRQAFQFGYIFGLKCGMESK